MNKKTEDKLAWLTVLPLLPFVNTVIIYNREYDIITPLLMMLLIYPVLLYKKSSVIHHLILSVALTIHYTLFSALHIIIPRALDWIRGFAILNLAWTVSLIISTVLYLTLVIILSTKSDLDNIKEAGDTNKVDVSTRNRNYSITLMTTAVIVVTHVSSIATITFSEGNLDISEPATKALRGNILLVAILYAIYAVTIKKEYKIQKEKYIANCKDLE